MIFVVVTCDIFVVHQNLKSLLHIITTERERLKTALEMDSDLALPFSAVVFLKQNLHEVSVLQSEVLVT